MLRRSLRHMQRYPSMTLLILGMPVIFLLLFVYVFGGTLGAGLGGVADSRAVYVNYVTPGIILLTVAAAAQATAISVAMDMTEGHHRPVPHHGHLPRLGADRPRPRQHDPEHARRRRRHRYRGAHRVPAHREPSPNGSPRSASSR
jgi:hypothetical protein